MKTLHLSPRFLVTTLILSLIPFAGGWWAWRRTGPLDVEKTILVKRGTTVVQVAAQLEREGVIRSAALFQVWARSRRLQLLRGEYTFAPRASLSDVANKLQRGEIHTTNVVLVPGMSAWHVQQRLRTFVPEDVFWTLWKSRRLASVAGFPEAETLEGLMAPATYRLNRAMEPEEVMLMTVEAFRDQVLPELQGGMLRPYETLVLASLAEKETNLSEELPRVAGVYAHRLRIGMRLQCDPTCLYARWLTGDLRFSPPNREDTRRNHRFNTYVIGGLPPTPIAIPGPEAIKAAKAPLETRELYFVATGKGGHRFAPSLAAHNRNVREYRREIKRQGRS